MLLPIYHLITKIIILDNILETSIVPKQTQLYDMVAELLPFHALVAIHIHLLEEVYQSEREPQFQTVVVAIVI